ncbi:Cysteine-rich receptor-like protein kinase 18 [Cardamine amara subsp. amara]|uniref:Cysteine-rich receptor-like protein kinase 18 n=1 Tax=Cardamine amara subsp. amara TaxID=228776 RepID=A0ABD1B0G3_CARAN
MAKKSKESVLCFYVFFFIISFNAISVSAENCDATTGIFKHNSPYDNNRRLIVSTLPSNVTAHGGYFNGSIGLGPDRVYAMGKCAPGAEPDVCSHCIKTTSEGLLQICPYQTDAFLWSGNETLCLVRYSNHPFSGLLVMEPHAAISNTGNLTMNQTKFDSVWRNLTFGMIAGTTSSSSGANNSSKYYVYDVAPVPYFSNISALMQCTPDVSSKDCNSCLGTNVIDYENCCRGHLGGVISRPTCFFRWELYPFSGALDKITLRSASPPLPPKETRISGGIIAAIIVVIVVTIILIAVGLNIICKRRKQKQEIDLPTESVQFDLKTIEAATSNFLSATSLDKVGLVRFTRVCS